MLGYLLGEVSETLKLTIKRIVMSIFRCNCCQNQIDSDFVGLINHQDKDWCDNCFTNAFQCEDCGGFKDKPALAAYDGKFCEC